MVGGATNDGVRLFPGKGYRYTWSRRSWACSAVLLSELNRGQEEERRERISVARIAISVTWQGAETPELTEAEPPDAP